MVDDGDAIGNFSCLREFNFFLLLFLIVLSYKNFIESCIEFGVDIIENVVVDSR